MLNNFGQNRVLSLRLRFTDLGFLVSVAILFFFVKIFESFDNILSISYIYI